MWEMLCDTAPGVQNRNGTFNIMGGDINKYAQNIIPASDPGRASATPRFSRGQPGLHRESIKMFNTSGMNLESHLRTGNDRLGMVKIGTAPGTTRTAPSERRFTYVP
ncbi:hypothetical protein DPMN_182515 [Dreissena polymorpha]|uniref:Uncharacterized protein n=1 Tax=Dreissena polymorpha TaxID=45954 RepID=A0A9D4DFW6_DREPO|nr:hypothetical protein DPMN_182515 [Dreissena polymorpha]